VKLYPELKENLLEFKEGWGAVGKQRKFFEMFARSKKFNPFDAEKWYSVSRREIIAAGGISVLQYYDGSHIKALVKLYPELALKKGNFLTSKQGRKFFDAFAKSKNFNPLDAKMWYSVTSEEISRAGRRGLLRFYDGSHIRALVRLYPELMLKRGNFSKSKV